MKRIRLTKTQFDVRRSALEALTNDWASRECTSFDDAVLQKSTEPASGTIWKMPAIDSKRVVALLVELEPVVECELPCSLVRRGGYATPSTLASDLLARIREHCLDDAPVAEVSQIGAASVLSSGDKVSAL